MNGILVGGRRLRGHPVGNFVRVFRIVFSYITVVIVVSVLVGGSPLGLVAKLNTFTTMLVLVFGSAVLNFITKMLLSRGSVIRVNS